LNVISTIKLAPDESIYREYKETKNITSLWIIRELSSNDETTLENERFTELFIE